LLTSSLNLRPAQILTSALVSFQGVTPLLEEGVAYEVDYWIDSNFGGGTLGVCDATAIDHQWKVTIAAVSADVAITEAHIPNTVVDVCSTFAS